MLFGVFGHSRFRRTKNMEDPSFPRAKLRVDDWCKKIKPAITEKEVFKYRGKSLILASFGGSYHQDSVSRKKITPLEMASSTGKNLGFRLSFRWLKSSLQFQRESKQKLESIKTFSAFLWNFRTTMILMQWSKKMKFFSNSLSHVWKNWLKLWWNNSGLYIWCSFEQH